MDVEGNLDPESAQIREVFAYFGLATYRAQCMERQLALLLATRFGPGPKRVTRAGFDDIVEGLFSKTLGQLVSDIKSLGTLNDDDETRLSEALEKRNWLAHRYFWERAVELFSQDGRASMVNELQKAISLFDSLDKLLTNKTMEWGESFGVTQQLVEREMEKMIGSNRSS